MENEIKQTKKKISPLLLIVLILLVAALTMCAAVACLWLSGRNAMTKTDQTPTFPTSPEASDTAPTDVPDGDYIQYAGKNYQYNQDIINILLIGIDAKKKESQTVSDPYQADVVVLAVLDKRHSKLSLVSLSRDIMCDIELLNSHGEVIGQTTSQLALSYAYGDGADLSCKVTCNAVSNGCTVSSL